MSRRAVERPPRPERPLRCPPRYPRGAAHHARTLRESPIAEVSFVSLRLLEAFTRREGADAWTMQNVDRSLEMATCILQGRKV